PPSPTLFPYTTLFRSEVRRDIQPAELGAEVLRVDVDSHRAQPDVADHLMERRSRVQRAVRERAALTGYVPDLSRTPGPRDCLPPAARALRRHHQHHLPGARA